MPLYEHVFIARQDLSHGQVDELAEHFGRILAESGGTVIETGNWGLLRMAYKIKRNRKGHYALLKTDAPPSAVREMERLMRLHDDVLRHMTVKVKKHVDGPTPMMQRRDDPPPVPRRDSGRKDEGRKSEAHKDESRKGEAPRENDRPEAEDSETQGANS